MFTFYSKLAFLMLLTTVLLSSSTLSYSAQISFTGTIHTIEVDDGTGTYAGSAIGDRFYGSFFYGDSASDATSTGISLYDGITPVAMEYEFFGPPYSGAITNGVTTVNGSMSSVEVDNNSTLPIEEVSLFSSLMGMTVEADTPFDSWSAWSATDGSYVDSDDKLFNGIEFGIIYTTLDTSFYSDLGFQLAPTLADVDGGVFLIAEANAEGNDTFLAWGVLDNPAPVPEPSTFLLLGSGLAGLVFWRKRQV